MMTNRKALQRRVIRLEEAVRMRDKGSARVHVVYVPGHWPAQHDTPEHADAERAGLEAYETEHGPTKEHDTVVYVTFVK